MRRRISFFELLGEYAGVRLRSPIRSCNTDRIWLEMPTRTGSQGNDYILKKNYKTSRPTSWMLQELAVHNLANNITLMSKRCKAAAGKCPLCSDKAGSNPSIVLGGPKGRGIPLPDSNYRYANAMGGRSLKSRMS